MNSVIKKVNGISITVDYRTELLGIIMTIGNYHNRYPHLMKEYDNNKFYFDKIKEKFDKFKDDEVVKEFDKIVETHYFDYDAPLCLFLQLDENLNADKLDDYTYKNRLQSDEKIFNYVSKLDSFAERINFKEFYESNREMYEQWIDAMSEAFKKYDITSFFKNYYGYLNQKDFVVNLIPFNTDCGYSCDLDDSIVSCYTIYEDMKKDKLFDCEGKEKSVLVLPVHEFSHGYVNPITDKYHIVDDKTDLFDDIRETMKKNAYPYDTHIINEHIIRAIESRYIYLVYGDEKWAERHLQKDRDLGFKYIDTVIESLIEYEDNRDVYKTFDDFYPHIIEKIKKEKEQTHSKK